MSSCSSGLMSSMPPLPSMPQTHLYYTPATHLHHINIAARNAPRPHQTALPIIPSNSALKSQFHLHQLCEWTNSYNSLIWSPYLHTSSVSTVSLNPLFPWRPRSQLLWDYSVLGYLLLCLLLDTNFPRTDVCFVFLFIPQNLAVNKCLMNK